MKQKKLAVLALLVVAVSQSSFGQAKPSAAVSDELVAAETEMFAKITQHDPAFMKDLVADDYFSINADGTTVDKAQLMAQKGSPQQKMMAAATYKVFDKQVRAYANVGIITGRARAYERHLPRGILVHGCLRQTERQVDVYSVAGNYFKGFSAATCP